MISEEEIINEFLGNIGAGISNVWNNIANNYSQGVNQNQLRQTSQKVVDLQNNLRTVGMNDQKVQNFLSNINNALKSGMGQKLSYQGQTMRPNQNLDTSLQNMRNMVRQGRTMQSGGTGI